MYAHQPRRDRFSADERVTFHDPHHTHRHACASHPVVYPNLAQSSSVASTDCPALPRSVALRRLARSPSVASPARPPSPRPHPPSIRPHFALPSPGASPDCPASLLRRSLDLLSAARRHLPPAGAPPLFHPPAPHPVGRRRLTHALFHPPALRPVVNRSLARLSSGPATVSCVPLSAVSKAMQSFN